MRLRRNITPLNGVLTLLATLLGCTEMVTSDECANQVLNGNLEVAENTECTIDSDIVGLTTITVHGDMTVTADHIITIGAITIHVGSTGTLTADGVITGGVGAGNSDGSGGRNVLFFPLIHKT